MVDERNPLLQQSPLKLKSVRQAINYAIDRDQLMMYMRNSIGTAAKAGMAPLGLPSRNAEMVKGYYYNPDTARLLLRQAGINNGPDIQGITLLTIPIYADIASFVAKQVQDVGLKIQVEVIQKVYCCNKRRRDRPCFSGEVGSLITRTQKNYMAMFYSKNPAPPNYTRYKTLRLTCTKKAKRNQRFSSFCVVFGRWTSL